MTVGRVRKSGETHRRENTGKEQGRGQKRQGRSDWGGAGKNGAEWGKEQTRQAGRADEEKAGVRQTERERRQGRPSTNHFNMN